MIGLEELLSQQSWAGPCTKPKGDAEFSTLGLPVTHSLLLHRDEFRQEYISHPRFRGQRRGVPLPDCPGCTSDGKANVCRLPSELCSCTFKSPPLGVVK